ncbi:MAG TPA: helix-turn-helix domain-containing protein [Armatimonadota bacterium]|nr:helix-turn-helix domain-containing protein [Armatimonadota bacterium]
MEATLTEKLEGWQDLERLLTAKQVAEYLNVSERTVWRLIDSGELPHIKIGKQTTRIKPEDLEAYVNRQRRGKASESESDSESEDDERKPSPKRISLAKYTMLMGKAESEAEFDSWQARMYQDKDFTADAPGFGVQPQRNRKYRLWQGAGHY